MALQEADYGITDSAFAGEAGRFLADHTLLVKFYTHPKLNQTKTVEEGRPIYQDVPYIQIMQPGNKESIIIRPATDRDKSRFAEHFKKFNARESQESAEGTPLSEWPGISRSQVEELRYFNVHTVEQLANVSDTNAQGLMGIHALRTKAQNYLEASATNATAEALAAAEAKSAHLLERLEALEAEMRNNAEPEEFEED